MRNLVHYILIVLPFGSFTLGWNSTMDGASEQLLDYAKNQRIPQQAVSSSGILIDDIINSLSAGPRGPLLIEDSNFFNQMQAFNRERISSRIIFGASGYIEITQNLSRFSIAKIFSRSKIKYGVRARFSRMNADPGRPDTLRDLGSLAFKFYTEEGNWDLVAINFPVFYIRDPYKFYDLVHALRPNPATNLPDLNAQWNFFTQNPETIPLSLFLYSDYGIPRSFRNMNGYSSNTYSLINSKNNTFYARFYLISNQGLETITNEEAQTLAGTNPDYYISDLYNNIFAGNFPSWELQVHIATQRDAHSASFNIFDPTNLWPRRMFSVFNVGKIVLNKNPSNYFVDVENIAFNPANMVPGIQPTVDRILQSRLFAYNDAQMYRLGVNSNLLMANAPVLDVHNYERDGMNRYKGNQGGAVNYFINSFNGPVPSPHISILPYSAQGVIAKFKNSDQRQTFLSALFNDYNITSEEYIRIVGNLAANLNQVDPSLQMKAVQLYNSTYPRLGEMLATALVKAGLPLKYLLA
ncbi:catalase-like isoform X2 [Cimex lectularius]|uniref:Catalase core domain-containing protein n=1 Tax=Cimex lectularius TaxID=79782 RepID=A0A8I6RTU1_CIMLE|nr:catalase-like isoform X2 [Cimex lectularius]